MKKEQQAPSLAPHSVPFHRPTGFKSVGRGFLNFSQTFFLFALATITALIVPQQLHAASQAWTNAPVNNAWNTAGNWVGNAVPGAINTSASVTDVATFTNAIFNGIGSASNPITNDVNREIASIIFDGANCGAYVFGNSQADNYLNISQGGFISMSAAVVNPIMFNQGVVVRLPSSTNGRYNFTNNAVPPSAVLVMSAFTNTSASTRPMAITLAGSNTGTNTIIHIDNNNNASGAIQIFKEGPGLWILPTANDIVQKTSAGNVGGIFIEGGTLEVQDPGALGTITIPNLYVTNAVLQADNITLNNAGITLRNGGIFRMNGIGMVNGITVSSISGNSATLATTSPSDILTVGSTVNTLTSGAADSVLHIAGPGTVLFPQPANYAGKWSVDSGTNQISSQGALGTGPNLNINAGSTFDISPMGATVYTLDTKALSANGTGTGVGSTAANVSAAPGATIDFGPKPITLTFTPTSFTGDTGHPALYCSSGALAFHGNTFTIVNASGTPLGLGTYQLVSQASGNISTVGAFVTLVNGAGLAPGCIAEITAVGGSLNMVVTAYTPKPLVWKGTDPTTPATWDRLVSQNWLSAGNPSTFNIYDSVTFNATGSAAPIVTLAGVMQPSSLLVDTSANDYTFTGANGQIAGSTSLIKINPGTLTLATANTYSGGTAISNGVIKLGIDEGISSAGVPGANDLTIVSPGVFDLNNFSNTVNGLNGNGTIDITGGGTSTLNIGLNNDNGVFSGNIQNTSGSLGIFKVGTGTETLSGSNSYVGPTLIDLGTLRVTNQYALGAGNSSVTDNNGTLDMQTSLIVSNLNGGGFVINSSATSNLLTLITNSTFNGVISGKIGVYVAGGTLRLNAANTYSNGTYLGVGAGLAIGSGSSNPGPGPVVASNNAAIGMPSTSGTSPAFAPAVTTVDGATVTFTSASTANNYGNQFIGGPTATNVFTGGNGSIGGSLSFSNFLGTVVMTNGSYRWFASIGGGDNTTFMLVGNGGMFARDPDIIHVGALTGDGGAGGAGGITGPSNPTATYWIGGKGNDSMYEGVISGINNIVKVGPGTLTLDGASATQLATDFLTFTNYQYGPLISYTGNTTVSNGVLKVVVPNDLSSSPNITLATGGILDANSMGTVSNFTDNLGNPNSALSTNGVFNIAAFAVGGTSPAQVVSGAGVIKTTGVINNGTINPGFPGVAGTLTLSNNLTINSGATNYFDLSDNPSTKPSDQLNVSGSINLSGQSYIGVGALNGTIIAGTYPLFRYTGSLSNESGVVPPGPIPNFIVGGDIANLAHATMSANNASGEIDLVVQSINSSNLVWTGMDPVTNLWDVATTFNFTNSLAGTLVQYFQFDNVTFDDTGSNNVQLVGGLAPNSITVTNNGTNYTFTGPGTIIGDTSLTKSGTNYLLLINSSANTFTGGTVINGGIIKAGSESAGNQNDLALGVGPVTINTGGQLRLGGNTGTAVNHFITNAITLNGGTLQAQDGVQHFTNSTVTINTNGGLLTTIFSGKNIVLDSPLVGAGNVTIASGTNIAAGQVILNNTNNTITGSITIATNGNLALVGFAGISNSVTIDVQQGGILDVTGRSNVTWSVNSGQTLKGAGIIRGKLINALAGSTIAPGVAGAIGSLTVTNNNATNTPILTLNGTVNMDINRASAINSDRIVNSNGTNIFGGTLTVNNLGAALQAGDTFQLFTSITNTGGFTTVNLPTLNAGLIWNNTLLLNGRISVTTPVTPPTVQPAITSFSLSFGTNVVLNGTNGQAGATYYLLTTTNVGTPVNQWKTIATNVATGDAYSFTNTNAVTPGAAAQFYMLSSTNFNP